MTDDPMKNLVALLSKAAAATEPLFSEDNADEAIAAAELKEAGYVTGAVALNSKGVPFKYVNLRITFSGREKLDAIKAERRARSWRGWFRHALGAILGWLAAVLPDVLRDVLSHLWR